MFLKMILLTVTEPNETKSQAEKRISIENTVMAWAERLTINKAM